MRKIKPILKLLKDKEIISKIQISFSSKTAGDDFDPYEDSELVKIFSNMHINGDPRARFESRDGS